MKKSLCFQNRTSSDMCLMFRPSSAALNNPSPYRRRLRPMTLICNGTESGSREEVALFLWRKLWIFYRLMHTLERSCLYFKGDTKPYFYFLLNETIPYCLMILRHFFIGITPLPRLTYLLHTHTHTHTHKGGWRVRPVCHGIPLALNPLWLVTHKGDVPYNL